ncbi:uncharacterized protein LOC124936082 [Impatiens glandulifera]|uniref:uncharacterized protein LOC124936082 n=1 Tax=Impatiens glandulifera TaxID=253017 RepID=UPI001FB07A03|nr:uncharacterized protein LOC124936082 [Impatiens glandulifera]XP_047332497.1 uncharacterized protein LOC124936082 [Impatiens glandulifera]
MVKKNLEKGKGLVSKATKKSRNHGEIKPKKKSITKKMSESKHVNVPNDSDVRKNHLRLRRQQARQRKAERRKNQGDEISGNGSLHNMDVTISPAGHLSGLQVNANSGVEKIGEHANVHIDLVNVKRMKKRRKIEMKYKSEADLFENMCQHLDVHIDPGMLHTLTTTKKLLILDINGILVDIVPIGVSSQRVIPQKQVHTRPFYNGFLQYCFNKFHVAVWSSRNKKNLDAVIKYLFGDSSPNFLFICDQSHCTNTGIYTLENKKKPLFLKELKSLLEGNIITLPWTDGWFNESNTLLIDDSPYKALRNPPHTAIFPQSYDFNDENDRSLGPGGDLRLYLERLASADNVQNFVKENPFGQAPITETNPSWEFYLKISGNNNNASSEKPVINGASSEEPVINGASSEKPVINGASSEEPVINGASSEEPVINEASSKKPIINGASSEEPVINGASSEKPVINGASSEEPVINGASSEEPVINAASSEKPVINGA